MAQRFLKVRFTSRFGSTAGLVLEFERYDSMTVTQFSELFPDSEAMKMGKLQKSPVYERWDDAFLFDFDTSMVITDQIVNPQLL